MRRPADGIAYLGPLMDPQHTVFDDLPQYYALGGHCIKCEHDGWVDRRELARKYGANTYIGSLKHMLRCRKCKAKGHNMWILGQLPR